MSSILDALRKLDEQKNARKQRPVDIAEGVVRLQAGPKPFRVRPWQVGVAIALVAAVSVLLTMFTMRPEQRPAPQVSSPAPPSPLPLVTTPVPPPIQAAPPVVLEPTAPAPEKMVIPPAKAPRQTKVAPAAQSAPASAKVLQPAQTSVPFTEAVTAPPAAAQEPSRPTPAPTPAFKLTGIGWQKEAASRFVVINGSAVGEGGSVDGAKVEEIFPDKVRLKVDGKSVEIGLGK